MAAPKSVVMHGGAEPLRYRNVAGALRTALVCGADMFEFDVRRTADGRLVVHHDAEVGMGTLADLTADEAIRAAGRLGYELLTFDAVLSSTRGRLRLDVELKEAGYEEAVLQALLAGGFAVEDFVITSFDPSALRTVRETAPDVRTGLLIYDVTAAQAFAQFEGAGVAFLGPDHLILDAASLADAQRRRIPLMPWTVNDREAMRRLIAADAVIGLITDRPEEALELRDRDRHR